MRSETYTPAQTTRLSNAFLDEPLPARTKTLAAIVASFASIPGWVIRKPHIRAAAHRDSHMCPDPHAARALRIRLPPRPRARLRRRRIHPDSERAAARCAPDECALAVHCLCAVDVAAVVCIRP